MSSAEYEIARQAFDRIRHSFGHLTMRLDPDPEHVDLSMEIPTQPGLLFDVHLNLQNRDELHLSASSLWVEWFPCTDPAAAEAYVEAVCGLLSGRFRILEYRRGRRAIRAELQRPKGACWETVSTWATLSLPWPRRRRSVVQNLPCAGELGGEGS